MDFLEDEFSFLNEDEKTDEEISKAYIEDAKEFVNKYRNKTFRGIDSSKYFKSFSIDETDIIPWKHISYKIDFNNLLTINNNTSNELEILDFVEEVSSIGNTSIGYNQTLLNFVKTIILPKSLSIIHTNTFSYYSKLENVKIAKESRLKAIAKCAFSGTVRLKKLDLTMCKELILIDDGAFDDSALEILKIPKSVNYISSLLNTKIQKVYVDNDCYDIQEFNKLIAENNGVFWKETEMDF